MLNNWYEEILRRLDGISGDSSGAVATQVEALNSSMQAVVAGLGRVERLLAKLAPNRSIYSNTEDAIAQLVANGSQMIYYLEAENLSADTVYLQVYDTANSPTGTPVYSRILPPGRIFLFDDEMPLNQGLYVAWSLERDSLIPPSSAVAKTIQMIYGAFQ